MISTLELFKAYGNPSASGTPYLIKITLTYPMILSWDRSTKINSLRCHKLIAENSNKGI